MSKPVLGLLLGGILGVFDGLTALFTPEVVPEIMMIIIGSTIKGIIAGVAIGFFARKFKSLLLGIIFGSVVGLILAFAVAALGDAGKHYYFEIMLPGSIVGLIVGFATQKYGNIKKLGWGDLVAATIGVLLFSSFLRLFVGSWSMTVLLIVGCAVVVYLVKLAWDSQRNEDSAEPQEISSK